MEEPKGFKVFSGQYTKLLENFDELNDNLALVLLVINPQKTSDIKLNTALQDATHRFFLVVKTNIVSFLDCFSRTENNKKNKMPFYYFYLFIKSLSTPTDFNDFLDSLLLAVNNNSELPETPLMMIVTKLIDMVEANKENQTIKTKLDTLLPIIKNRYPSIIDFCRKIDRYIKYFDDEKDIKEEIENLEPQENTEKAKKEEIENLEPQENTEEKPQQNIKTRLLNWIHKHPYPTIFVGGVSVSLIILGVLAKHNKFKLPRLSWPFSWPSFTK